MQVALQGVQRGKLLGRLQPLFQGAAGAFEDIHSLLEEDRHHFLIEGARCLVRHQRRTRGQHGDQLVVLAQGSRAGLARVAQRRPGQAIRQVLRCGFPRQQQEFIFLGREIVGAEAVQVDEVLVRVVLPGAFQQALQGRYLLWSWGDLQGCSDLVHHADQCFVAVLDNAEERLADLQPTLFNSLVERQQSRAQVGHLRQFGHLRAATEGAQFVEQGAQFLALLGMFAPAAKQILGIQQDVHAFREEDADHARVVAFAALIAALGFGRLLVFLVHLGDPFQQRGATLDGRQRPPGEQLFEADTEQAGSLVQQLGFAQVHLQYVGLEILDQSFQRRRHFGDRQDAGHVRAALEGMQGTLQIVGHRLRQFALAVGEEGVEGFQMGFRLVAEDFQQLRIQAFKLIVGGLFRTDRYFRQRFRDACQLHRLALGQGMGGSRQGIHVIALALGVGGELANQLRQQRYHTAHGLADRRTRLDAAIEDAIEQALYGPGQLTDDQCADHPSAALEGVEGATDLGQRIARLGVVQPQRQLLADGLQHLAGFFDEDFAQVLVHRLLVRGRRQQARRGQSGRRVERGNRGRHDLGQRQRRLLARYLGVELQRHVQLIRNRLIGDGLGSLQAWLDRQVLRLLHDQLVERLRIQGREVEQGFVLQGKGRIQAEIDASLFRRGLLLFAEGPVVVGRQQFRLLLGFRLGFREFDIPDQFLAIRRCSGGLAGGILLLQRHIQAEVDAGFIRQRLRRLTEGPVIVGGQQLAALFSQRLAGIRHQRGQRNADGRLR
ncbi:hypothetical protein D3C76_503000 [compost metagenome]